MHFSDPLNGTPPLKLLDFMGKVIYLKKNEFVEKTFYDIPHTLKSSYNVPLSL